MCSILLGICILATSFIFTSTGAVPIPQDEAESDILYYENVNDSKGNYRFSFATVDNTRREETGQVVNAGQPDQYIEVNGFYSYVRPDGKVETVYFVADKDGFRPVPAPAPVEPNVPVLAAVPPAILASLAG